MRELKARILSFRVTQAEYDALLDHVDKINSESTGQDINTNQYLRTLVRNNVVLDSVILHHDLETIKKAASKTQVLAFRVTQAERDSLLAHVNKINSESPGREINANQYLQVIVRNNIGLGSNFLRPELEALKETNRVLLGIGRNLNQIVKKINSGEFVTEALNENYLKQMSAYLVKSRAQISTVVEHNQKRIVKLKPIVF